ncbi:MAG TPA: ABC transporter ATP-binding protein [Vicinamibacterales bacterium]|nr:ABC transporter ATP-binding protein [Vicinamibacterales bacterium]
MLRASDLSYGYTTRSHQPRQFVLRDVSVSVTRGSLTGLLGPNGCGKTTLLKLLSGVLRPQEGAVALNDAPLAGMSRREVARHMAVVPQETHPAFDYTVMEMVLMGRHPHLGAFELEGPEDLLLAGEALAATDTAHLAGRAYMTLSGGEKQRVVIASALTQAPDILLLDEPTASLDLGYQLEVAALLSRLNRDRGVTMVIATHDLNLAASLCDRLVLMRDGRVVAQGPTREVLTAPMIQRIYGVDADVQFHRGAGHLTVTPMRRLQ